MLSYPLTVECNGCGKEYPANDPRPSCNECECCFCTEECREKYHRDVLKLTHDFNAHIADI